MSIARHHAEWLSLVPVSGPFLSLPVLMEAFPQGLDAHDAEHARLLRLAYEEWDVSFQKKTGDPSVHAAWIKFVLTKTLEFDESLLAEGQAIPQTLQVEVAEHGELLRPNIVLNDPATKKARMLVRSYPRTQDLTSYVAGSRWKASPETRMTDLLHGTGVRVGLVTNGEHWMLVDAPKGETTGYASWYASIWREEKITLQAFRSLLSMPRFFGVGDDETIEALLTKSASNQQEVTDQLGSQVLRAVEVLIQSLDKADQDHGRALLEAVNEARLYESALTVMMRLVFLFCAEERELIPTKPFPVYEQNYSVSTISKQLREIADQHGEELLERRFDAWPRVLSAFRAVYGGLAHDDVYMPAYGGRLFDPDRFPFLEGRQRNTSWRDSEATPLPVNNRTVLHLLEALQLLQVKVPGGGPAEARRISFRALDIEQIGHVYEGLLDHTAKRAAKPTLGLIGKKEPEVALQLLEQEREKGDGQLHKLLKDQTGSNRKWENYLDKELDDRQERRLRTACGNDDALFERVKPFAALVRDDSFGYPVVVPKGSVFVTAGTDRRSSGTHYTPRSLTIPIVQYTLEPLVYVGPAEGKPKSEWKLKSAAELLDLKICDMACGSGAFLVQATRYMSERLMEAWDAASQAHPDVPGITPEGEPSTGAANESLIPTDPAEQKTYAMRIIAQRCLYGVDINPLAAEMAKLSLWLLTLAKDKPFEFLDHSIRCGDSLVGLHDLKQLRHFSLKPDDDDAVLFKGPLDDAVDEAIELRLKLEDMPSNTVEDVEAQEKLLKEAEDKIARLRCAADLLVAGEFWGEDSRDKQERVRHFANVCGHYVERGPTEEFEEKAQKERRGQRMFHWPLEYPEVVVKRNGFDAFLGNPPFQGGTVASTELGYGYMSFIKSQHSPWHGKSDLVGAFFRRAFTIYREHGFSGFLATASLIRGETCESSIVPLVAHGATIYRACSPFPWPGQANVTAVCVWMSLRITGLSPTLDELIVKAIGTDLEPQEESVSEPNKLNRVSLFGALGVKLAPLNAPISRSQADGFPTGCKELLVRVIGGDEIYGLADLHDAPLAVAPEQVDAVSIELLRQHLSHELTLQNLRHSAPAKALRSQIELTAMLFACGETTHKQLAFRLIPRGKFILKHKAIGFPADSWATFAVLQSEFHVAWAWKYGIRRKQDLCYSPKRCASTFPLPYDLSDRDKLDEVDNIGQSYHQVRDSVILDRGTGLTQFYNLYHDVNETAADIKDIRERHVTMDQAVRNAFGWSDLNLAHDFHDTKQGTLFTISEAARREVLQRLLKLNHEHYEQEVAQGLHDKKKSKRPSKSKRKPKKAAKPAAAKTLFDMGDEGTTFPTGDSDRFLCGLLCDLVAAQPGLGPSAYRDALVILLRFKRHGRLLVGNEKAQFVKLCKKLPKDWLQSPQQLPWLDLIDELTVRKAVVQESGRSLTCGNELAGVRSTYPECDSDLVTLLLKAATTLRELQQSAKPEKQTELSEFQEDVASLCGESP